MTGNGRKLRVALVFGTYPPMKDGGADFVYNLASHLDAAGVDVSVITTSKVKEDPLRPAGTGFKVYPLMEKWHGEKDMTSFKEALRIISPDVVHVIYPSSYYGNDYRLPFDAKSICRKPLVTTFFSMFKTGSYLSTKFGTLKLVLSSDCLVSHNFEHLRFFNKFFPFKRTEFIPVGNNMPPAPALADKKELRERYGLREDLVYLAFPGQLDMSKGADTLMKALRILIDKGRSDVRLIMIGSGDREKAEEKSAGYKEEYLGYAGTVLSLEKERVS